ncbi:MAG: von Willebrand factor, type [Bryobacterales bacterium]|nr:von Willebrand factor, type [Bryobacterales bacterium]
MRPTIWLCLVGVACCGAAADDENTPVFRSEVSMGRIDTLVMDRSQHPISGLRKEDFLLRQDGKLIPIRNLSYEDLPVDVLLLLDVSGSMRVHVQKVASAAHGALAVLGDQDRVGIMVFDSRTRLRLPFRQNLNEVERKLDDVVQTESFNGGTNINGALLDAAAYVERQGRPQTRHAIVIVTDDQASPCDQARISAALDRADAVLMVLLAPAFMGPGPTGPYPGGGGRPRGYPPVLGPWPGGQDPLGGIILGRRRGPSGIPVPGSPPVTVGNPGGISAGSPQIARASGGDALNVNDAAAAENTFERIRRRYAIYFYPPAGIEIGRGMQLDLTESARRKHPDAALQYRQVALAKDGARPGLITRVPAHPPSGRDPEPVTAESSDSSPALARRRPGVSDSTGPQVVLPTQPAIDPPTAADQAATQEKSRRRAVSEPDSTPRVSVRPAQ